MPKLPFKLPAVDRPLPGQTTPSVVVNPGSYDVLIGGHGFRLATDQQFPYTRTTEPTTTHRYDSSLEPGEQSLSPLPWIKSQSSFHAGAGQLNLEAPFTAFQYQQEQVEHVRYDMSQNVDPWTPGVVKRLPDVHQYNFGFAATACCTAVVNGIDYAIIGGAQSLYQVAWNSGPDAAPTISAIDMSSATFGGLSNCTVSSLTTDGTNYYAVLQLTVVGSTAGILTYIIKGSVNSASAPTALYEVPNYTNFTPRTNLCTNPNFETDLTGWAAGGSAPAVLTTSTTQKHSGTQSVKVTSSGNSSSISTVQFSLSTIVGATYTASAWVYVPSGGMPTVRIQTAGSQGVLGQTSSHNDQWERISVTWTATSTSILVDVIYAFANTGLFYYMDDVLIEKSGSVNAYFDGSTPTDANYAYSWTGTVNESTSSATPLTQPQNALGIVGWVKERLIGAVSNSVYELPTNVSEHSQLPTAKYTHPIATYMWSAISQSPTAIVIAGATNGQSSILQFALDTSGNTPTLGGGATIAVLPPGEKVLSLASYLASFLAIGTSFGVRIGTFDTYTGALTYGPLSLVTTQPVLALTGRDRFVFAGYTNQQPDGKTGLATLDLSVQVDTAQRVAWAPGLRPPTTAPTGVGTVTAAAVLPGAVRLMFLTPDGIHVEGNGPGQDGDAWLRTSRIRYGTEEMKLFKIGRVHGTLDTSEIEIVGSAPWRSDQTLATLGFVTGGDPGPFKLMPGLNAWMQLSFHLQGSSCQLNSYQVKALPAPTRQRVTTMTLLCFRQESDKTGRTVIDPEIPWVRYQNLRNIEGLGAEIPFVEFGNLSGTRSEQVVIDELSFRTFDRPTIKDDFAGYIDIKLRATES